MRLRPDPSRGDRSPRRDAHSSWSLVHAAGLGAALMYFLDPRSGPRRRALARDQITHAARLTRRAQRVTVRDLANRSVGALAEAMRPFRNAAPTGRGLAERVRAKLGRYVSHPHAVRVAVQDGRVTLSGPILAREVKDLLQCVRHMWGVRDVEDRLEQHEKPDHVSALQGGVPRPGERSELFQDRWAPATRFMVALAGGVLLARGTRSGGLLGALSAVLGGGLIARAAANRDAVTLLGLAGEDEGIEVQKSVRIAAPVERVFGFWMDYRNFPRFMSRVRDVRPLEHGRSRWVVSGPGGVPVDWSAEIVRMEPSRLLEWRSDTGSAVRHHGVVRFDDEGARGTRVDIRLVYVPPAGVLGHAVAAIFGADPKSDLDEDLMRMKTLIETGRAPHDAAQGSPRTRRRALTGGAPAPHTAQREGQGQPLKAGDPPRRAGH